VTSDRLEITAATRRGALKEAVALMKAAKLDTPVLDARLIVQHALGVDWNTLFMAQDRPLDAGERVQLEIGLARRAAHEPVSRIVGRRHFWTLNLEVTPDTLDPRPDTETLIEAAVAATPDRKTPLRILDLGTGTGGLLIALLREYPEAIGIGVDVSPGALGVAKTNASSHGIGERAQFRLGHWTDGIAGPFDLIVSNPPYIERGDLAGLPPEVREYDPMLALDGGPDGLDAYRAIIPALAHLLAPGGLAILEIGDGQGDAVVALAEANGLKSTERRRDLGNIERALSFRHAG
jgi:release factor glutamine methyltransferase